MQQQEDQGDDEEFNIFHLWSQLLSEMFDIFNWYEGALSSDAERATVRNMMGTSIFTGTEAKETVKVRGFSRWGLFRIEVGQNLLVLYFCGGWCGVR